MMLLYLQLTPLRFAVPADAAAVRGASRPGAHRGHHEALGEHRGQLDTAAVIGPILGAGVATVITLMYQGLRRESETRARLVTELTAAQERLAATERRAGTLVERDRLARKLDDTRRMVRAIAPPSWLTAHWTRPCSGSGHQQSTRVAPVIRGGR
jgi:hypothetical protein